MRECGNEERPRDAIASRGRSSCCHPERAKRVEGSALPEHSLSADPSASLGMTAASPNSELLQLHIQSVVPGELRVVDKWKREHAVAAAVHVLLEQRFGALVGERDHLQLRRVDR